MGILDLRLFRRKFLKQGLFVTSAIGAVGPFSIRAFAHSTQVRLLATRIDSAHDQAQVTFDLTGAVDHNVFVLHHPERVVVDLEHTVANRTYLHSHLPDQWVTDVRSARRHQNNYRIVLDLRAAARVSTELLRPSASRSHYQLVVRLFRLGEDSGPVMSIGKLDKRLRDLRVVIDPGHGGKDPGAIGKHGTEEKDVVLRIAHRLHRLLNDTHGVQAVMTRRRDYFLHLQERVRIAERHKADLFLSIHADANPNRTVKGSSVYILSEHGASSVMARRLAARENSADSIGNINLGDKSPILAKVLLDLSQTATIQASADLGKQMLEKLGEVDRLLSGRVERAAFVVLKSPDIPSLLVETAFISNPNQERRLRTPAFQRQVAQALHAGILDYLHKHAPPGTLLSSTYTRKVKS